MSFNSKYINIVGRNPIKNFMNLNSASNFKPFSKNWLNNAHLETLLPGSSWEKVYDLIIPELCQKLLTQFSHENRKQALFELLGKHFVSKYFPQDDPDSTITRPPVISSEESIKLYDEARRWLDITVERIIKENGIYDRDTETVSEEMKAYIEQATNIFMSHFKKELTKRESEYFKKISTFKPNFRPSDVEIRHKPETAVSSVYDQELPYTVKSISPYGPEMLLSPLPHCISFQAEFIGEALGSLCFKSEKEIQNICLTMSGRRLPISLRKFIWKDVLLHSQSPIYDKEINYEDLLKEKFNRTVTRGLSELKISKEIKSPVNELLENLIIEHYEKSLPLNKFCDDVEYLSEAVKILNILYVYDRSYDPHLVFWLFPLHFGLKEEADSLPMNRIPFNYDVAMFLSLLSNVYPSWSDIFNISEDVLQRLSILDPDLAKHIYNVAQYNVLSKPKDFLAQIMDIERNKAKMKKQSMSRRDDSLKDNKDFDILKSPIIFIRKWIGEGFVSVLNGEAVLFIFDQLFMERFSFRVFEDACLAIIFLLKIRFLVSEDHESMKTVFLEYPSSLFTVDFIRAWTWIHRNGNIGTVPEMNRRETHKFIAPEDSTPRPIQSTIGQITLPYISLNDIRLKLIFSATNDIEINEALAKTPDLLYVKVSLILSNSKLIELTTHSISKLKSSNQDDSRITNSYKYDSTEVIDLASVDITHLTDVYKEGDSVAVIISVVDRGVDGIEKTLGWCILPCLEERIKIPEMFNLDLQRSYENYPLLKKYALGLKVKRLRYEVPLISGEVPADFSSFNTDFKEVPLMLGSMLSIYSYDKSLGPPSPPPITPIVEEIVEYPPVIVSPHQDIISLPPEELPERKESTIENPKNDDSWVPFDEVAYKKMKPHYSSRTESFCVYIDQIRFLPDTATIIKVTGRFFHTGLDEQIKDILIFPDVETEPRSPKFRASSRIVINKERTMNMDKNSILILRVYTLLNTNLEIVIVGNVIVPIFDLKEETLFSGCFQKRLRNPPRTMGLVKSSDINRNSLDNAPYIDCVSITYRIWPYTENIIVAPEYNTGVYESSDCKPTRYEWDIFNLYNKDTFLSKDLREVVKGIKYRESNAIYKNKAVTHTMMLHYIPSRFEMLQTNALKYISPELMFHYRIEKGINLKVYTAYGLPEEKLVFVSTKVIRGEKTIQNPPRPSLSYGLDEFSIFSHLDHKSPMKNSKWMDSFQMIKPYYDEKALLVIQVWGLNVIFKRGIFYDKVTDMPFVKLTKEHLIGWTALSLFKHGFVNTGKHQLPLFNNRIHHALLKRFQTLSISKVLQTEEEFKTFNSSSIVLYLYDAHKQIDEYPSEQPMLKEIIEALQGDKDSFDLEMEKSKNGRTVFEKINEVISNEEMTEKNNETKLSLFNKSFHEFVKKLPDAANAKQPYLPVIF